MSRFTLGMGIYGIENLFGGDPRAYLQVARQAEQAGFQQLSITDHVVMGDRTDRYPYGEFPAPPEYPWFEPITTLAAIAAVTERIELSQSILISPLRSAVLLAKQAATLDVMSGGRVVLGLGTGWQREEYTASQIPFSGRKKVMFEQIDAMKALWRDAPASFHGETLQFENMYSRPAPLRAGGIPCWVGVKATEENCKLIARSADGWIPIEKEPAEYGPGIKRLRQAFSDAGRDPDTLAVRAHVPTVMGSDGAPDLKASLPHIEQMLEVGVTHVEILPIVYVREAAGLADFFASCVDAQRRYG